jgi:menaquinol-cytochrome c reductase iron-sulfur subunit
MTMDESNPPASPERRGFLKKIAAVIIGGIATLFPAAAGLTVFLDPLRRKSQSGQMIRVITLAALPADGMPRKFPVIANRSDAWSKFTQVPIGAVYLRRTADNQLQAFNVVCPHAGCFIDYIPEQGHFLCPCHNSSFTPDGKIDDPQSPSPRRMDDLKVEVRNGSEVWVMFQNFQPGHADKLPIA